MQTDWQAGRQVGRWAGGRTGRQADRQTDRWTDTNCKVDQPAVLYMCLAGQVH